MISGVSSPAPASSPSCEVRNELVFPSLPTVQPAPAQPPQPMQEPAKVPPKISQLSELDQQLSKLHNSRPVLQGQMTQTYSDAVRQSPTTVQPVPVTSPAPSQPGGSAAKLSRFVISKVSEPPPAQQPAAPNIPKSTVSSPENEQQPVPAPSQQNQAQQFFQLHHGGVVSKACRVSAVAPCVSTKRRRC